MLISGNNKEITLEKQCPWCGKTYRFNLPTEGYTNWLLNDMLVQEAFPNISLTIREHLISGYCEDCQDKVFDGHWDEELWGE